MGPSQFIDPAAAAEPSPSDETSHNGISRVYPTWMREELHGEKWRKISFQTPVKTVQVISYISMAYHITAGTKRCIVPLAKYANIGTR
jgi:hypothetical protein